MTSSWGRAKKRQLLSCLATGAEVKLCEEKASLANQAIPPFHVSYEDAINYGTF